VLDSLNRERVRRYRASRKGPGAMGKSPNSAPVAHPPAGRAARRRAGLLLRSEDGRVPVLPPGGHRGAPGPPGAGRPGRGSRDGAVLRLAPGQGGRAGRCRRYRGVTRDGGGGARVEEGTAIAAVVPGYVCELYDAGSHVQISLFPPADPAAVSWTLVIAGSVKEGAALPDGADVIELESLHDQICEHLRPVWDAYSAQLGISRPRPSRRTPVRSCPGR
jgi:hypothetical protein